MATFTFCPLSFDTPIPSDWLSPLRNWYFRHDSEEDFRDRYQREARSSRRVVAWATILSLGLAISCALVLYSLLII